MTITAVSFNDLSLTTDFTNGADRCVAGNVMPFFPSLGCNTILIASPVVRLVAVPVCVISE